MSKATQNSEQSKGQLTADDLGLVDDRLEDESKSDEEIFDEIGAAEAAAANGEDDADNKLAAESHAAADKDDDPDKKAGEEPSGHDDKDTQQTGEENEADKLWAEANDEQRAAFDAAQAQIKKLEQSDRSQRGRVSTLQRQVNDITKQFDRVASTATPDKSGDSESAAAQSVAAQGAATNDFLDSKDWKEFDGEYPEVAGPLGKLVSGMKTEITGLTKQLDAIGNDRRQEAVNEQTEILEKVIWSMIFVVGSNVGLPPIPPPIILNVPPGAVTPATVTPNTYLLMRSATIILTSVLSKTSGSTISSVNLDIKSLPIITKDSFNSEPLYSIFSITPVNTFVTAGLVSLSANMTTSSPTSNEVACRPV